VRIKSILGRPRVLGVERSVVETVSLPERYIYAGELERDE